MSNTDPPKTFVIFGGNELIGEITEENAHLMVEVFDHLAPSLAEFFREAFGFQEAK